MLSFSQKIVGSRIDFTTFLQQSCNNLVTILQRSRSSFFFIVFEFVPTIWQQSYYYVAIILQHSCNNLMHSTCENKREWIVHMYCFWVNTNNLATILQEPCNSGIAHVKIRLNITYKLYLSVDKQSCNNPATKFWNNPAKILQLSMWK